MEEVEISLVSVLKKEFWDCTIKVLIRIVPQKHLLKLMKLHYARLLESFSVEQEPDLCVARHLILNGSYVVDVGANIGVYTKFLSRWVGDHGVVYSVEPIPSTYEILSSNIKRLQLRNVKPINCTISDSDGIVTMEIPIDNRGVENHYEARVVEVQPNCHFKQLSVEAKTIDSLLFETNHNITFIKIDTEGHELLCTKGALRTIKKYSPALLIEISTDPDDPESEASQLVNLLKEHNYDPWWFDGKILRQRLVENTSTNYFFLNSNHVDTLRKSGILVLPRS